MSSPRAAEIITLLNTIDAPENTGVTNTRSSRRPALIFDLETDGLLDTMTKVHCVVMKPYLKDVMAVYVAPAHQSRAKKWAEGVTGIDCIVVRDFSQLATLKILHVPAIQYYNWVAHNSLGFDIHVLKRFFGISLSLDETIDTLAMSRFLYPDLGSHSLDEWSKASEIKGSKVKIRDWENESIESYLERCAVDVLLTEQVYGRLREEFRDPLLHEGFRLAQHTYLEMCRQEQTGVLFDLPAAKALLTKIDAEMKEIAAEVEPQFGEAPLPKNKQPTFPKRPFKKDGGLSATAIRYGQKLGITDPGQLIAEIRLARQNGPRVFTAPVSLDNMAHVKQYLVNNAGWKPTMWRMNDITMDGKKKETADRKRKRAAKYVKDVWTGPYCDLIWDILGTKPDLRIPYEDLDDVRWGRAVGDILRRGKDLPMSPQIANPFKVMCPNLEKLEGTVAKKIMRYMSLKNRRGVLATWIVHPRLKRDGRLPAGSSGLTNTHRQRHVTIVNLPAADEETVYGKEIRSLFVAPPGMLYLGYDASGLEARIAGHLAAKYDNGAYAHEVLEGDIHTKNAAAYSEAIGRNVTRKDGKSPTYALMYGCGKRKIATMFDVSLDLGQKLIDAFWNANPGLKAVMEELTTEWESTGREYVRTVDGRRVYTRSGHSLLNALIQSTGAITMDRSWKIFCDEMDLNTFVPWDRVLYMHDEFLIQVGEHYAETVGEAAVASIVEAGKFYDLRVPLDGEYKTGLTYATVH